MEVVEVADAPGPGSVPGSGLPQDATAPAQSPTAQQSTGLWSRITEAIGGWWSATIKPPAPTAGAAAEKAKVLTLNFTLPFKQPIAPGAPALHYTVTDPSMFIWIDMSAKDGVRLAAGAPANCSAVIGDAELDPEQKRLNEAFGGAGMAMGGGAKTVVVKCGTP